MRDFTWSPKENILAYWVAEDKVTFLTSQGCMYILHKIISPAAKFLKKFQQGM